MWYLILMFVIVFELAVSIGGYYLGIGTTQINTDALITGMSDVSVGMSGIDSPLDVFVSLTMFQVDGMEALSVVFIILHLMFLICIIKIVIEVINATGQWIPFT